ncbi:MAG: ABC transporter permease, partial [Eubacterium sp.]
MNLRENIILALEGLRANKMRALLTMLGIIIGIASVIAITSLGEAMSNSVASSMESLGGKNIQAFLMPKDIEAPYTTSDEDLITNDMIAKFKERYGDDIAGVALSTSVGAAKTVGKAPNQDLKITGVNGDYFGVQNVELAQGRMISERDVEGERNVAIVSDLFAKNFFGRQIDPIGKEIQMETTNGIESYFIVGVYVDPKTSASQNAMINFDMGGIDRSEVYIPI